MTAGRARRLLARATGSAAPARGIVAALALSLLGAVPAHALKVVSWNLFQYPTYNIAARQPALRTVFASLQPDVLIVQEMLAAAGRESLLLNVLDVVEPGQWAATAYIPTAEGAVFYKPARVSVNFGPSALGTAGPRDVLLVRLRPAGSTTAAGDFRVYSVHYKAGNPSLSPSDSTTRRLECTDLRNSMNLAAAGTQILVGGDTNFYGTWEGGYARLTESQADDDGRMKDTQDLPGTWNTSTYRFHHSQSPCASGCGSFSGGGLDDRFDFWMTSYNLQDGEGLDVVPGTAFAYGNDGQHYNQAVNGGGFNNAVPLAVANALLVASDHLPAVIVLQVPSRVAAAPAVDFGSVLTGAAAERLYEVANAAAAPADELDYTLAAPAGFGAPSGPFTAGAGAPANAHTLTMDSGAPGPRQGALALASSDPDTALRSIALSGRVLAHAEPSLDSTSVVLETTLDFGTAGASPFPLREVRVQNLGYSADQARLSVTGAEIAGGDGRFTLEGGFQPALIGATGRTFTVRFDAAGGRPDTTYEATLTFQSSDEPLPGAIARPDLVVRLAATTDATVDAPEPRRPQAFAFAAPRPNPLSRETAFAFDLPRESAVELAVFDLGGRRLARPVAGTFSAGHHEVRWRAEDEHGAQLAPGLYFVRFSAAGLRATRRLVVIP